VPRASRGGKPKLQQFCGFHNPGRGVERTFTEGFDTADLKEAKGANRRVGLSRWSAWRKSGANDRFLVNPTIRWRGQEWLLRVGLFAVIRPNGRLREGFRMPARRERYPR
jgi:hypothetical protein